MKWLNPLDQKSRAINSLEKRVDRVRLPPPPPFKLLLVNNLPISVFSFPLYLPREIRNRLIEEPDRALHRGWAQVHVALRRREIGVAKSIRPL